MTRLIEDDVTYFPIEKPIYEVGPGLKLFGTDCGQANWDKKVFQISPAFSHFRNNKIQAREESYSKYIAQENLELDVEKQITKFIFERLMLEYPEYFKWDIKSQILFCSHTLDKIKLDENFNLLDFEFGNDKCIAPKNSLDALMLQVPEDIAILKRKSDKDDYLAYLNLCSPSHWAAQDKIGKNFYKVHEPVASAEKLLKAAPNFVDSMIRRGPFVRFVWSFVTDTRLNHHPSPPPGWDLTEWKGRSFDNKKNNPFYFRVERQTVWGFPEIEASLFTIRVSFKTGASIKKNSDHAKLLTGALNSMTPASRVYKGVDKCFEELIKYLVS